MEGLNAWAANSNFINHLLCAGEELTELPSASGSLSAKGDNKTYIIRLLYSCTALPR